MKIWRLFVILVAVLALAAAGAFVFRGHLANLWIQHHLASALSAATGAKIELHDVAWGSGVLRAGRWQMSGGDLPFERLTASNVRTPLAWRQFFGPLSGPLHVEVGEAELVWKTEGADESTAPPGSGAGEIVTPDLDLLVAKLTVTNPGDSSWSVRDTAARAVRTGGTWSFSARGGKIESAGLPPLAVERFSATLEGRIWTIGGFALRDEPQGALAGSATNEGSAWSGEFSWQDLDAGNLLPAGVKAHFTGKMSGDATLRDGVLRGKAKFAGAVVNKVPQMVQMASLFAGENWDTVPWDVFRFEFARQADGRVEFEKLEAVSPKGLALHGAGHYGPDRLAADLQLGVSAKNRPWLVAFVPAIFRAEKSGYFWTTVRVTGTPEAPKEDLSARLAAAAATVPAAAAIEAAAEVPGAAAEAAGDLLRGLLGR